MGTKVTFQDTLKSKDTEEWLDLVFYRPLGYLWALFFKKIHVIPNVVTILSILLGIAAGVMFCFNDLWMNVIGILLLIWANTFDSADGQLARMTGNYSRFGRMLDGVAGECWFFAIYAAICLRLTPEWGFWIWLLAAITGFFHGRQAAMADHIRNFHLLFINGKKRSEMEDYAKLREQTRHLTWKHDFFEKLFMFFYVPYTKGQEKATPNLQLFRKSLTEKFGDEDPPQDFRQDFRRASKPMMKYANILTFNIRSFVLFICLIAGFPWVYFLFELTVMNLVLLYMLRTYENICERFNFRLRGNA